MGNSKCGDIERAVITDEIKTVLRCIKEDLSFENTLFKGHQKMFERMSSDYASIMEKRNPSNDLILLRITNGLQVMRKLLETKGSNLSLIEQEIQFLDTIVDSVPENLMNLFPDHGNRISDLLEGKKKVAVKCFDILIDLMEGFQIIYES